MVTSCCVPECNQKGKKTPTGEKVSFFEFPCTPTRRKQWIHTIHREEGKEFKIVDGTKVYSLHFRREDLRKSFNGRLMWLPEAFQPYFLGQCLLRGKRKAPPERLPQKKKLFATTSTSSHTKLSKTDIMAESLSESTASACNSENNRNTEPKDTGLEFNAPKKIEELEEEVLKLQQGNTELKKKLDELEKQNEAISARLFSLERFPSDADINFYTGLANYATFLTLFNFLNPGENGDNIRPRSTLKDVPEDLYDVDSDDEEENITPAKKGRPRKLKPVEEFFNCVMPLEKRLFCAPFSSLVWCCTVHHKEAL